MFLPLAESLFLYAHPALLRQTHVREGIRTFSKSIGFTNLSYLLARHRKDFGVPDMEQ